MTARTARNRPAAVRFRPESHDRRPLLPWWAVLLPALTFALLLALLVTGGPVDAPGEPAPYTLADAFARARQFLTG